MTRPSSLSPCDQESLFPAACYRYKGVERLSAVGSQSLVKRECSQLKGLQRRGCFHGLGYASIDPVWQKAGRIGPACSGGSRNDEVVCIEGVIEKLADVDTGRAKAACASLDGEFRRICDQGAQRKMYGLDKRTFGLYYDKNAISKRRTAIATGTR